MTPKHPCSVWSRSIQTCMPSHSKPQLPHSRPPRHSSSGITTDRKYNIVIFGVFESPLGMPLYIKKHHNYNEMSSILSKLYDDSSPGCSILDCQHPGGYSDNSTRPRPILATLSTTAEVRYMSLLIVALCPPLFPLNLIIVLLRGELRRFLSWKYGSSSKQVQIVIQLKTTIHISTSMVVFMAKLSTLPIL